MGLFIIDLGTGHRKTVLIMPKVLTKSFNIIRTTRSHGVVQNSVLTICLNFEIERESRNSAIGFSEAVGCGVGLDDKFVNRSGRKCHLHRVLGVGGGYFPRNNLLESRNANAVLPTGIGVLSHNGVLISLNFAGYNSASTGLADA